MIQHEIQNHSVTTYIDNVSSEEMLKILKKASPSSEIIINGKEMPDTLSGRPTQMFTFIEIHKDEWRKLQGRKAFRDIKTEVKTKV